jgi:hypothetical protein
MTALETESFASSSLAWTKVAIIITALYLILKGGISKYRSTLKKYWYAWFFFLIIEFLLYLIVGNGGVFEYLHNFFAPFCFLLVYYLCILNSKSSDYLIWGFVGLFLFTGGYAVYLTLTYSIRLIEVGNLVSNLVFWPTCAFVFIPAVRNQVLKFVMFVPMILLVLFLAKRSAIIIVVLEILFFSFSMLKNSRRSKGKMSLVLYIVIGLITLNYITSNFSQFTENTFERFEEMEDDKGSGRVVIYQIVSKNVLSFSPIEMIAGRGYGSFKETGHTNAHNDALQLLYEFGLIGLMFYIALLLILFRRLKVVKKYAEEYYVGYIFCFITIVVLGMFSNLITFNSYFAFLCSYLAMAEAGVYRQRFLDNRRIIKPDKI